MNEFITWEFLASFSGAVAAVTLLTQLFKKYINIDPKWIALVLSVVVCASVQIFYLKDTTGAGLALMAFNIFAVLAAAVGGFEVVIKNLKKGTEDTPIDVSKLTP